MALRRRQLLLGLSAASVALACDPRGAAPAVHTASRTRSARALRAVVPGIHHVDGAGVKLFKQLGHRALPLLDPFLMLDRFRSNVVDEFARGFPDHPHRGFETVSIVLDGHVRHGDSVGNRGDIAGGGLQWMTAGRGIIHQEMLAASAETGWLSGYQLWTNLPAAHKMKAPRYQDLTASAVPSTSVADARVRVLAGQVGATRGPVDGVFVRPTLLDVSLDAGARFVCDVDAGHNAFCVVVDGAIDVGGAVVHGDALGVFDRGDVVDVHAARASRLLLFAAAPIGEPVARRGPFVMNTDAELDDAVADYRAGRLLDG